MLPFIPRMLLVIMFHRLIPAEPFVRRQLFRRLRPYSCSTHPAMGERV